MLTKPALLILILPDSQVATREPNKLSKCSTIVCGNVYNTHTMSKYFPQRLTRREALGLLGMSAAAAALPSDMFGQSQPLSFPKGAVIRTLLKDYAPEELAGGATLF